MADIKVDSIKGEIDSLCKADKRLLVRYIERSLATKMPDILQARTRVYINTIEEMMSLKFSYQSRKRENVIARSIIAYALHKDGYSSVKIGKALHHDHSSVLFIIKKWSETLSLPHYYKEENELWNEFTKRIHNETDRKTI